MSFWKKAGPEPQAPQADPVPQARKVPWPRIHLIYFALASVDVAAIAASLVIGFHMLSTFEKGADRNLSFDRQSASLIAFSSAITEAQSVVVSGLMQKQMKATAADVRVKAATFRREFALFRQQMTASVSAAAIEPHHAHPLQDGERLQFHGSVRPQGHGRHRGRKRRKRMAELLADAVALHDLAVSHQGRQPEGQSAAQERQ